MCCHLGNTCENVNASFRLYFLFVKNEVIVYTLSESVVYFQNCLVKKVNTKHKL